MGPPYRSVTTATLPFSRTPAPYQRADLFAALLARFFRAAFSLAQRFLFASLILLRPSALIFHFLGATGFSRESADTEKYRPSFFSSFLCFTSKLSAL